MTNHETIIELNKIWYNLICGEYHKDRDCHFRIAKHYFYGDRVEYEVEHNGYILKDVEYDEFNTLDEAEEHLIHNILKAGILQEIDFYIEHYGDKNYDQHARYNKKQLEDLRAKTLEIAPD